MGHTKWPAIIIIVILVLLAVILFLQQNPTTNNEEPIPIEPEPPREKEITVTVSSQGYFPETIKFPAEETVTLTLRTTDGLIHGITIPNYQIEDAALPGEDVSITFYTGTKGRFLFYDHIGSHANNGNNEGILDIA